MITYREGQRTIITEAPTWDEVIIAVLSRSIDDFRESHDPKFWKEIGVMQDAVASLLPKRTPPPTQDTLRRLLGTLLRMCAQGKRQYTQEMIKYHVGLGLRKRYGIRRIGRPIYPD